MKRHVFISLVLLFSVSASFSQKKSDTKIDNESTNTVEGYLKNLDGFNMYYRFEGIGNDTIVILHGGPAHSGSMLDLRPLGKYFRILFYDQRGGGKSDLILDPNILTWQKHVNDLEQIRKNFKIDKLKLVGISWGGMLAALYASEFPQNVDRMLISPMRISKNQPEECLLSYGFDSIELIQMKKLEEEWVDSYNPYDVCERYFKIMLPKYMGEEAYSQSIANFCDESTEAIRYMREVFRHTYNSIGDWDFKPVFSQIHVPTLIVRGRPADFPLNCFEWANTLPNSRLLWIKDTMGWVWITNSDIVFGAAGEFFNGKWPEQAIILHK